VSWDGSRFQVAGDAATVLSSADGAIWTTLHTGAAEIRLQAVSASATRLVLAWGNNRFVAVGQPGVLGPRAIYTTR